MAVASSMVIKPVAVASSMVTKPKEGTEIENKKGKGKSVIMKLLQIC